MRILCNKFGFRKVRQKGSHAVLVKQNRRKVGTVVPMHKELKPGTLKGVLKLAAVDEEDFSKYL